MSTIEILVGLDIYLLPVEACIVQMIRCLARSLLLRLHMTLGKLEAILWLGRRKLTASQIMLSRNIAIASIWISRGLLKSIVYLWVCTSNLRQYVRGETIALLTNRLNAWHKHGVFRLRICSWSSLTRKEWGTIYDFVTLIRAVLLMALCVAWWGKVWLVQGLSLMFMTDVFHFILVSQ